jgi:hypothetical protein
LVENCPVEFCIAKLGLVEPRAAQNGTGKIEAGEIEARELLAREIGRLKGCCGSDGSLDVCARHLRRCHLRRRQIDVLHHILRGSGNGGREAEHSDHTDPDRRAYHRLPLLWACRSRAAGSPWQQAKRFIARRLYPRAFHDQVRAPARDEDSALELLD